MANLTNRELVYCAECRKAGRDDGALRLESVGFLSKLRAVSYTCEACAAVTAVSIRRGSLRPPTAGACWNCGTVADDATGEVCRSCAAHQPPSADHADGVFFTYTLGELGELAGLDRPKLEERLAAARADRRLDDSLRIADALTHRFSDASSWRLKADLYLERGLLPLALAALKRTLLGAPDDLTNNLELANILELLEEPEEAEAVARRAAELGPADPRPPTALASLLARLERFAEAEEMTARAIALAPERADAWATLATLNMRKEDFAVAVDAWSKVLAAAPDFPLAWRYKGMCHLYLDEYEEARSAGEQAGDDDDEALEITFEGYLGTGDHTGCLAHAARCVRLRPKDSRFLYLQARAQMAAGAYADGLTTCDAIITLEPDANWARKARAAFAEKIGGA